MLEEHTNLGWWVRMLRPWRRTLIISTAPPPTGVAPIPVISVSPATIVQGAQVTFSRAGTTVQNVGTMVWRVTRPDTTTEDLGPFAIDATADIPYQPTAVGTFSVKALMIDTVNGLTAQATMSFAVTASVLAVGSVTITPPSGAALVGATLPFVVTVRSVATGGTLAQKKTALLSYLSGLATGTSKRTLTGQNFYDDQGAGTNHLSQINAIFSLTGEYPAILGVGWDWYVRLAGEVAQGEAETAALNWSAAGGLVLGSSWPMNPSTGGGPSDTNITFHDLLVGGSAARTAWFASLDVLAAQLTTMKNAGVVTLFRPFVELNGNWFWWGTPSKASAADFIAVWQEMWNYLMTTKGLQDALIWVFNVNAGQATSTAAYPGSAYVDIVGMDYYGDTPGSGLLSMYNPLAALSPAKPIMICEFGAHTSDYIAIQTQAFTYDNSQLIRDIASSLPKVIAFMVWDENWAISKQNGAVNLLGHAWSINRDDFANRPSGTSQVLTGRAVTNLADAPAIASVTPTGQAPVATLKAVGRANIQSTCETILSNIVPIDVSAPVPAPTGAVDDLQPPGFTPFAQTPMGGPTAQSGATGLWTTSSPYGLEAFESGDADQPYSPTGYWRSRMYSGMKVGIGPGGTSSGWDAGGFGVPYREVYLAWVVKIALSDYQALGVVPGTKMGFLCYGADLLGGGGNSGVIDLYHDGQQVAPSFRIAFIQQNNVARTILPGNSTGHGETVIPSAGLGKLFICGRSNVIKIHAKLNSANGVADGWYRQWINGVQTHDYRDVVYMTAGAAAHFHAFKQQLTWGGNGPQVKTRQEDWHFGHAYLAGIAG